MYERHTFCGVFKPSMQKNPQNSIKDLRKKPTWMFCLKVFFFLFSFEKGFDMGLFSKAKLLVAF
jgi:hypothetical protein